MAQGTRSQTQKNQSGNSLCMMPDNMICKCGGGQSCIVDRRWVGDFVHEDIVFQKYNLPIRKTCIDEYTEEQKEAMNNELSGYQQRSIIDRWKDDGDIEKQYNNYESDEEEKEKDEEKDYKEQMDYD